MAGPLTMPNDRRNLMRCGFDEAELDNEGSDRVVDAVVAWGDLNALAARMQQHLDAGASHVCVRPLDVDDLARPDLRLLEALAPRLRDRVKAIATDGLIQVRALIGWTFWIHVANTLVLLIFALASVGSSYLATRIP